MPTSPAPGPAEGRLRIKISHPNERGFPSRAAGAARGHRASDNYLSETGWGSTTSSWTGTKWSPAAPGPWLYGAGGGVSTLFPELPYPAGGGPGGGVHRAGQYRHPVTETGSVPASCGDRSQGQAGNWRNTLPARQPA
jgi:hypothetical protein